MLPPWLRLTTTIPAARSRCVALTSRRGKGPINDLNCGISECTWYANWTASEYTLCLRKKRTPTLASCSFNKHGLILKIFGQQHQHTFRNDKHVQLSLSLHFYLFYLLLSSCEPITYDQSWGYTATLQDGLATVLLQLQLDYRYKLPTAMATPVTGHLPRTSAPWTFASCQPPPPHGKVSLGAGAPGQSPPPAQTCDICK